MENKTSNVSNPAAASISASAASKIPCVAIILAAGYSSRMGEFKPLLPVGGKSALENLIDSFIKAGVGQIVVVTGYSREPVKTLIDELNEKLSHIDSAIDDTSKKSPFIIESYNPDFDDGMFSSIKTGLRAVMDAIPIGYSGTENRFDAEGLYLLPVDYPLIRPEHLKRIFDEARKRPDPFIVPCYMGKKGHPLWIPGTYWQEILDFQGEGGLKAITSKYDDTGLLYRLEMNDEAVVLDMDTPEGYQEVLDSMEREKQIEGEAKDSPEQTTNSNSGDLSEEFRGRILLVRHGRTEQHADKIFLGQTDVPLSKEGQHDAFLAGQELAELKLKTDVLYTSDLVRATESAEIIKTTLGLAADGMRLEIIKVPEFREMNLGDWDGRLISDIKSEFAEEYEKRGKNKLIYKRGHDGENFYDLQYRVMKKLKQFVQAACQEGQNETDIIIVAHRGVIKVIICNLLGYGLEAMETFDVPRGSVTNLDYRQKVEA